MQTKTAWQLVDVLLRAGVDRLLLYGPPGMGKSHSAMSWASEVGADVHSVTVTDGMSSSRLEGHYVVGEGGQFRWHDGVVVRAWWASHERPTLLLIEELPEANGDVEAFLHACLNDPCFARLDLPTGEVVRPGKWLVVVGTMNGEPSKVLRPALCDRFAVKVEITVPSPGGLARLADDLRPMASRGTDSLRPFVAFQKLREIGVDPLDAPAAVWHDAGADVVAALGCASAAKTPKGGK